LLVHGVLGAVGSIAAQLAHHGGATVIGTVRSANDAEDVPYADHVITLNGADPAAAIRALAPEGSTA
jgi:NADPH:quinone reductase